MKSLHSFAKEYNLPKSTVHNRAKSLGIDTSNGLGEEEVKALKHSFNLKDNYQEPVYNVPTSAIAVLEPDQITALDTLASEFIQKSFQPVELNGGLADALQVAVIASKIVNAKETANQQTEQELSARKAKQETVAQILEGIKAKNAVQDAKNKKLRQEAEQVEQIDDELKQQLEAVLKSL